MGINAALACRGIGSDLGPIFLTCPGIVSEYSYGIYGH